MSFNSKTNTDDVYSQKLLLETKKLTGGKKIYIFSRSKDLGYYSCNICGVKLGKSASDLRVHLSEITHKELSKLSVLPFRNFMANAIVADDNENTRSYDPLNSLRFMLETMCDLDKMNVSPEGSQSDDENQVSRKRKREKEDNSVLDGKDKRNKKTKSMGLEAENNSQSYNASLMEVDSVDLNTRRFPMNLPKSYRTGNNHPSTSTKRVHNYESLNAENYSISKRTVETSPEKKEKKIFEPTFMSMCRRLITLEQFLGENETRVRRMFTRTIEMERERFGSSNNLLNRESLELLKNVKGTLSQKIDYMPAVYLDVVDLFYTDMLYFTKQYYDAKQKSLQ